MARVLASLALVLAPCPVLRAPSPAPAGTVMTTTTRDVVVSDPRLVRAQSSVPVQVVTSVGFGHRPFTPKPARVRARPLRRTGSTLRPRKPHDGGTTANKRLTASEFAASLPAPWPAVVRCESLNDGSWRVTSSSRARGLFQFLRSSWRLVGGHGDPAAASFGDQWSKAQALLRLQGWSAWDCARMLHVGGL